MKKVFLTLVAVALIVLLGTLIFGGGDSPQVEPQVDSLPAELTVPAELTAAQDSL